MAIDWSGFGVHKFLLGYTKEGIIHTASVRRLLEFLGFVHCYDVVDKAVQLY